jgi:AcrR family transcriptional regulator
MMVSAISWARKSSTPPSNWCWRRVRPRRCSSSRWRSVSGVTSPSICLHFADKDALPDAVRAGYFEKLDAEMQPLVSKIDFHMKGARRASICSWMPGDIGFAASSWPAEHVRGQELAMVGGEMRWSDSIYCCFTRMGVGSKHGSTADQGRTGREDSSSQLWRLARALGTHAKQSPSTGHSAVGLRAGRETVS